MQEVSTKESLKGRSEYQHEYYEKVTKPNRQKHYMTQTQYWRVVEVKKVMNKLKRMIGTSNYGLIMSELNELEIKKMG